MDVDKVDADLCMLLAGVCWIEMLMNLLSLKCLCLDLFSIFIQALKSMLSSFGFQVPSCMSFSEPNHPFILLRPDQLLFLFTTSKLCFSGNTVLRASEVRTVW